MDGNISNTPTRNGRNFVKVRNWFPIGMYQKWRTSANDHRSFGLRFFELIYRFNWAAIDRIVQEMAVVFMFSPKFEPHLHWFQRKSTTFWWKSSDTVAISAAFSPVSMKRHRIINNSNHIPTKIGQFHPNFWGFFGSCSHNLSNFCRMVIKWASYGRVRCGLFLNSVGYFSIDPSVYWPPFLSPPFSPFVRLLPALRMSERVKTPPEMALGLDGLQSD